MTSGDPGLTCTPLTDIPVVMGKSSAQGELVVVIDSGMSQAEWQLVRLGLEQLFSGLQPTTRFTKIENNAKLEPGNILLANTTKQVLRTGVFPETLAPGQPLDLARTFRLIEQEVCSTFSTFKKSNKK